MPPTRGGRNVVPASPCDRGHGAGAAPAGRLPVAALDVPPAALQVEELDFRRALGRFVSGITVVTTVCEDKVHGMTVNGFVSVSLDPPQVLIALGNKSKLRRALESSGRYGVSVLREGQETLSRHFANQLPPGSDRKIAFEWKDAIPLIPDTLARLVCAVVDVHRAGDHTLFIGRVEHLDYSSGSPLVFFTGEYGRMDVQLWDHSYIWKPEPWT